MIQVYIASSLRNFKLNETLCGILEDYGFRVFLPQRDSNEIAFVKDYKTKADPKFSREVLKRNIGGIARSDAVLVIAKNIGFDTVWDYGFSAGVGKPILLVKSKKDKIRLAYHFTLYNGCTKILCLNNYRKKELMRIPQEIYEVIKIGGRDIEAESIYQLP